MRSLLLSALLIAALSSCKQGETSNEAASKQTLNGSWRLASSKSITGKDTVDTSPAKDIETIKLYNDDHFSFFTHDLKKGKIDTPVFSAGAGTYTLSGNNYAEHLEYCNARGWENQDFKFTIELKKDTLMQRGVEKIDSLHIDHIIVETYVRMAGK
jgi:hypothetical protein